MKAAWAIVEPILDDATPVYEYQPGTWGLLEANRLVSDLGGWHDPEERKESKAPAPRAA